MSAIPRQLLISGTVLFLLSLLLAGFWGTSRATPIAGAGHKGSGPHEATVTALMAGGSVATVAAVALVLWGLLAWKA